MMPEDRKILQNNIMLLSRALLTLNDELKIRVKTNLDECLWCIKRCSSRKGEDYQLLVDARN